MKLNRRKFISRVLYYPILIFICLELALLILGYRRYIYEPYSVKSSPNQAYIGDSLLGIQLVPGRFEITLNDAINFEVEHTPLKRRKTCNQPLKEKADVLFMGCSFTYGYGVNDNQTFTSILQTSDTTFRYENLGVIGYGTVQSLLQLKQQIKSDSIKAVILNFSSFHLMRNNLGLNYRKNLKLGYARASNHIENQMKIARFPYLLNKIPHDSIYYEHWDEIYKNWPGREWLASINWLQTQFESIKENKEEARIVTINLIKSMAAICEANHIAFGLVCLDSTEETEAIQKKIPSINWLNVEFDFNDTSLTHLPYDSHPNQEGHLFIANKIDPFLRQLLYE